MKLNDLLFGRPLRSSEEAGEKLGPVGGLSVFGLDALSSAAYGPEAALTLLIPLAAAGITYIVPITASIIILLAIVYFSYPAQSTRGIAPGPPPGQGEPETYPRQCAMAHRRLRGSGVR